MELVRDGIGAANDDETGLANPKQIRIGIIYPNSNRESRRKMDPG